MSHSYRDDQSLNPAVTENKADQPSFEQVLQARLSRRDVLAGGAAWMAKASLPLSAASLASLSACATHQDSSLHRSANGDHAVGIDVREWCAPEKTCHRRSHRRRASSPSHEHYRACISCVDPRVAKRAPHHGDGASDEIGGQRIKPLACER